MRAWRFLAVMCLVGSCGKEAPAPPAAAPAVAGPASATTSTVGERLASEAAARRGAAPSVEHVERALEAAGHPIARVRQVLAGAGARYCAALVTRSNLALSLCEFDAPAAAQAGLARARDTVGRALPGGLLATNGTTLLTIAPGAPDEARAVAELFTGLGR